MNKGILQLALSGKVPLQLEYREVNRNLRELEDCVEISDVEALVSRASSFTGMPNWVTRRIDL